MRRMLVILAAGLALSGSTSAQGPRGRTSRGGASASETNSNTASQRAKPGSRMSSTQQSNVDKLAGDLNAIKQGSQVSAAQKQALKADLMAMADGATKPDPALVQQLANDLASAMADGKLTEREKTKLANDLKQVMNSANIPMSEVNQAISDAQAILQSSGVSRSEVQTVANDLKAIATEAQKNASSAGKAAQSANANRGRLRRP